MGWSPSSLERASERGFWMRGEEESRGRRCALLRRRPVSAAESGRRRADGGRDCVLARPDSLSSSSFRFSPLPPHPNEWTVINSERTFMSGP